uniref:Helicase ARIP4 n=1 Tax=Apis cerana TaxID=7461 RepID=V9IHB6_APICE
MELKQEVKDESGNQSDISNMSSMSNISRPISTESAHRFGQESTSQSINIMPENPYIHQGYETHNMLPSYVQDNLLNKNISDSQVHINENYHNDISQNTIYNANANPMSTFDSMKSEVNCHGMQQRSNMPDTKFGVENQNSNNIYSGLENRSQTSIYPNMETRNPNTLYHGVENHHSVSMYPNYDNSTNSFSNYSNRSTQESDQDPRKDCFKNTLSSINSEINVKKEPEETVKKEESTCTTKEETISEEKKEIEKIKTPFIVDAPIGVEVRPRHFRLHILNDSHKTMAARAKIIQDWQIGGGVLLIGYELYRQLSLKKPNKAKRKRGQPFKDTVDVEEEDKNKGLLDEMHTALVNPGPDLVICDEGHRIKNSHASISMALKQMRTKRRIVLTGYPLQNNLLEYWCMVDFVRPNYLGTKSEFCNMFERPIQNGQCIDSTPQDIRLMRYRAHVLHALLEGFVQRRSHSVLQVSLPRKEEYILLVRMTSHQRKLYDTFMNQVVKTRAVPNPLKAFAVCCKIWNHPDILYHFLRKRQANEEDDLDLEETIGEKSTPGGKRSKARQSKGETKKGKKQIRL